MLQVKKFQKRLESFVCAHCKTQVVGGGYTDHCPQCLWSRHVDINPGDRQCRCRGLMAPVSAVVKKNGFVIFYVCQICGFEHQVKAAPDDNFELILSLTN
ncbi:MAG TPA: RNHCP domain-containing protein [bacterium]|nr:RNHCP domain-containing protein [bacterium]